MEIQKLPKTATVTAELEDGTKVAFDKDCKTTSAFKIGTKITKIKITAPGYKDETLEDHTIVVEIKGDENEKEKTLTKLQVESSS